VKYTNRGLTGLQSSRSAISWDMRDESIPLLIPTIIGVRIIDPTRVEIVGVAISSKAGSSGLQAR
jgi:hypothetical protein